MNKKLALLRVAIAVLVGLGLFSAPPVGAQEATPSEPSPSPRTELLWQEVPTLVPVELVYPADFVPQKSYTLIVALHGYGSTAKRFLRVADELAAAGFLVAVPEATYAFDVGDGTGFD